jgi:hypothetical protein
MAGWVSGRLSQEDCKFKARLFKASLRPCLKKKQKTKNPQTKREKTQSQKINDKLEKLFTIQQNVMAHTL